MNRLGRNRLSIGLLLGLSLAILLGAIETPRQWLQLGLQQRDDLADGDTIVYDSARGNFVTARPSRLASSLEPRSVLVHAVPGVTGTGTAADPWVGWESRITWTPGVHYKFADGYFAFSTQPAWKIHRLWLEGSAWTVLKWTGGATTAVINQDELTSTDGYTYFNHIENLILDGGGNASHLIYNVQAHRSVYKNIRGGGSTTSAITLGGVSYCKIEDCSFIDQEGISGITRPIAWASWPTKGIVIGTAGSGPFATDSSTQIEILNCQISTWNHAQQAAPTGSVGIHLVKAIHVNIIGGDSEVTDYALKVDSTSDHVRVMNTDMESSTHGIVLDGQVIAFDNCNLQNDVTVSATGKNVSFRNCWMTTLANAGHVSEDIYNRRNSYSGAGTVGYQLTYNTTKPRFPIVEAGQIDGPSGDFLNLCPNVGSRVQVNPWLYVLQYIRTDQFLNIQPSASSSVFVQDGDASINVHNGNLIVKYQDGATTRYKYLDLKGTGSSWAHTTSAP